MRNIWRFLNKYNAIFFFVIFFAISIYFLITNNNYQKASSLNSSNQVIGVLYEKTNEVSSYLTLGAVNDSLARENARLKNSLKSSFFEDSVKTGTVKDSLDSLRTLQYNYIVARVVNKSVNNRNNYLTINRGSKQGIQKGMGVVSPGGVVGIVRNVSENFASVQSILHQESQINSMIEGSKYFGPLKWDGSNSAYASLADIPNNFKVKPKSRIVTSGLGTIFPQGIPVGTVVNASIKNGGSFLDIKVKLATNFYTLQYVYVIKNFMAAEQQGLEDLNKKDDE